MTINELLKRLQTIPEEYRDGDSYCAGYVNQSGEPIFSVWYGHTPGDKKAYLFRWQDIRP